MATEIKENIPGHWDYPDPDSGKTFCITIRPDGSRDPDTVQCSTMRHHWEREDDSFRAFPSDLVWTIPMEDGGAAYLIRNEDPLILVHIPCGDGYHATPDLIRDLQPEDITRYRARVKRINQELARRKLRK